MRFTGVTLAVILCLSSLIGCEMVDVIGVKTKPPSSETAKASHKRHGPPPHAPAHGYRHKHQQGPELEYDNGLGVYLVVKMPGVYFYNGLYLRISGGLWNVASHFSGPWHVSSSNEVPLKLREKKGKGLGKKKKKIKKLKKEKIKKKARKEKKEKKNW